MAKHALRYSDDVMTKYHKKLYKLCVEGKASGMTKWTIFHWASAITMPELVEINLVSDDDDSLTDRK